MLAFSPRDHESIIQSIKNSDIVINLIGKHYETKHVVPTRRENGELSRVNYSFDEVHSDIPRTLAKLSKEAGVQSFIHVSAISADLESQSAWSQSKAKGEAAVKEEFPEAVSFEQGTRNCEISLSSFSLFFFVSAAIKFSDFVILIWLSFKLD